MLESWRNRHGSTQRLAVIESRQLALLLERQPDEVCEILRQRLSVHYYHQREVELARGAHPSSLDPGLRTAIGSLGGRKLQSVLCAAGTSPPAMQFEAPTTAVSSAIRSSVSPIESQSSPAVIRYI